MTNNTATGDSDDLESLFDSIVAANAAETNPPSAASSAEAGSGKVINQIGHMARTLHDTLRELGLNKEIEKAASSIPDARDRLNYVATLTQQAAEKVLNATDAAQPILEKVEVESHRLAGQWQMLFEKKLDVMQFRDLVMQLVSLLLENAPASVKAEFDSGLLNGPVINAAGRTDVVTSQDQVDDLLESLGF